jgi:hypothetical protein
VSSGLAEAVGSAGEATAGAGSAASWFVFASDGVDVDSSAAAAGVSSGFCVGSDISGLLLSRALPASNPYLDVV